MIVEPTNTGYSVYAQNYPVATTGKDLIELKSNMVEALNLYFEENGPSITENDIKVTLDLAQFFEFYKVINAKAFSERIGMNQSLLAQYISGKKAGNWLKSGFCFKQNFESGLLEKRTFNPILSPQTIPEIFLTFVHH